VLVCHVVPSLFFLNRRALFSSFFIFYGVTASLAPFSLLHSTGKTPLIFFSPPIPQSSVSPMPFRFFPFFLPSSRSLRYRFPSVSLLFFFHGEMLVLVSLQSSPLLGLFPPNFSPDLFCEPAPLNVLVEKQSHSFWLTKIGNTDALVSSSQLLTLVQHLFAFPNRLKILLGVAYLFRVPGPFPISIMAFVPSACGRASSKFSKHAIPFPQVPVDV